jgi:hypothetical protein
VAGGIAGGVSDFRELMLCLKKNLRVVSYRFSEDGTLKSDCIFSRIHSKLQNSAEAGHL